MTSQPDPKPFRKGSKVQWKWAGGIIEGVVEEIFKESITKTIKGKKITRHGSPEKPAYLVKSIAGNIALKLQTELSSRKIKTKLGSRSDNDYR
ncbi:MAG: DUF2945 domain-containing protein [Bdellovibrionota bacterium]